MINASKLIPELQAIEIAESMVEGFVTEMELEEDNGHFIYEIAIKTSFGFVEIGVDAITGTILKRDFPSVK